MSEDDPTFAVKSPSAFKVVLEPGMHTGFALETLSGESHALRWVALTEFGVSAATGAFIACLVAGVILTPVSRHSRMPFAATGFSSVVSMTPGVFMFTVASGLVQLGNRSERTWDLMGSTLADGPRFEKPIPF
jgi:uncharacterized membrane protein YjjB (DUF3815 family)